MKKFEYKVIPMKISTTLKKIETIDGEIEKKLNEIGANGWNLVQITPDGSYFFVREMQQ